jgi:predicted MPP superfamily phosphohydrolase
MNRPGFLLFAVIAILLYIGINYYIGLKLFRWLEKVFPGINGWLFTGVYSLIAITLILGFFPFSGNLKYITSWIGSHWMGIFLYLLLFFVVVDLIFLILKLVRVNVTPTMHFFGGLTVILLTIGVVSYGLYNATQVKQVSYSIKLKENTTAKGMKIVLISDIHLGAIKSEERLEDMVAKINALEPDLICVAGDIFNDDYNSIQDPEKAMATLRKMKAKYGVYASLGNHDGGETFGKMIDFLKRSNIHLLNDDYTVIDNRLILVGRLDASPIRGYDGLKRSSIKELYKKMDPALPVVVMDHNPAHIGEYGKEVDLILSGHTHKGQVFPGNLITNQIYEVDYGYYQRDANSPHVVVTSGVGTWGMPMKVGSNSEVVYIQLN